MPSGSTELREALVEAKDALLAVAKSFQGQESRLLATVHEMEAILKRLVEGQQRLMEWVKDGKNGDSLLVRMRDAERIILEIRNEDMAELRGLLKTLSAQVAEQSVQVDSTKFRRALILQAIMSLSALATAAFAIWQSSGGAH